MAGTLRATPRHMEGRLGGTLRVREGHLRGHKERHREKHQGTGRDTGEDVRGTRRDTRGDTGGDIKEKRESTGLKIGSGAVPHSPMPLPPSSALFAPHWLLRGRQLSPRVYVAGVTNHRLSPFLGGHATFCEGTEQGHTAMAVSHPFPAG